MEKGEEIKCGSTQGEQPVAGVMLDLELPSLT